MCNYVYVFPVNKNCVLSMQNKIRITTTDIKDIILVLFQIVEFVIKTVSIFHAPYSLRNFLTKL